MRTPIPNAFTLNTVGSGQWPFPLSCSVARDGARNVLDLCSLRVVDLLDVFEAYAGPRTVVLGLGQNSHTTEDFGRCLSLREVAAQQRVSGRVLDDGTLIVDTPELARLLDGVAHYDLACFGLPRDLDEDALLDILTEPGDRRPVVSGGGLSIDAHDDCYLWAESHEPEVLRALVGRAVEVLAGTAIWRRTGSTDGVHGLPAELLRWLFERAAAGFTVAQTEVSLEGGTLRLPFRDGAWTLRDGDPTAWPSLGALSYDVDAGRWRREERSPAPAGPSTGPIA